MSQQVRFYYGTKSEYNALNKDNFPNDLFFLTDTYEIYRGADLYTTSLYLAANEEAVPPSDKKLKYLYVFTNENYFAYYDSVEKKFVALSPKIATSLDDKNNDNSIPTVQLINSMKASLEGAIQNLEKQIGSSDGESLGSRVGALEGEVDALQEIHETLDQTIADTVVAKIAEQLAGADTSFDTLQEIADYLQADSTRAAEIIKRLDNLEAADKTINDLIGDPDSDENAEDSIYKKLETIENELNIGDNASGDSLSTQIDGLKGEVQELQGNVGDKNVLESIKISSDANDASPNFSATVSDKNVKLILSSNGNGSLLITDGHNSSNSFSVKITDLSAYAKTSDLDNYIKRTEIGNYNFATKGEVEEAKQEAIKYTDEQISGLDLSNISANITWVPING